VSDSHPAYPLGTNDFLDTSEQQGAKDIGAKMKSRAGIYDFIGERFHGDEPTCKDMNQKTYDMVLSTWNQTAEKRVYESSGSLISFGADD